MKNYFKEITAGAVLLTIFTGLAIWFVKYNPGAVLEIVIAGIAVVVGMSVFIINLIKKRKDVQTGAPSEDEFTKLAKLHAGSKSFFLSVYFWFFIYIFHAYFPNVEEMLGIGFMGSALIYGICIWYYKSTGKFNEKSN